MDIPGIGTSGGSLLSGAYANQGLDKDSFMKLLVTQLQNQDPLEPTQNQEFVAQLATFSSLEQLEELNDNTVAMIALNQSNALLSQLTQSSALIGKSVSWTDPQTGQTATGSVDSVRIIDGLAVLQVGDLEIPLAAVTEVFEGATDAGESDESDEPTDDTESTTDA